MTARVSVCIPCFDSVRWIAQAVQSALDQTWPDVEVIVVDDGSTDGSLAVLENFGGKIRLISGAHRGGNHARNEAVRAATGEWIQFLDADDYLEPEKIARQLAETCSGADADVLYSPVWIETVKGDHATRELSETSPAADIHTQWIAWQIPQTGGCLWRRAALGAIGGWREDQPCCQEHELYLRALKAGHRFVFAPTAHAVYRVWSEETLCRRDPGLVVRERTRLIDELRAWLEESGQWTATHQRAAGRACFEMARTIAKYDMLEAAAYHRDRRTHGMLYLDGPAAPSAYRLAHWLFGFKAAERLAAARR